MAEIILRHFVYLVFNTLRITPCRIGHGSGLTLRFALTDPYGIALLSNCVPFNYSRIVIAHPDLSCNYLSGGITDMVLQDLDSKLYLKSSFTRHFSNNPCLCTPKARLLATELYLKALAVSGNSAIISAEYPFTSIISTKRPNKNQK